MFRFLLISIVALSGCWTLRDLDPAVGQNDDSGPDDLGSDLRSDLGGDIGGAADGGDSGDANTLVPFEPTSMVVDCGQPTPHPSVQFAARPTGALAPSIGFVEVDRAGIGAELAWVGDGNAYHAAVDIGDFAISLGMPALFSEVPEQTVTDVAIGPDDSQGSYIWAATTAPPCVGSFWWGGTDAGVVNVIPCGPGDVQLFGMEVAGGFNPFTERTDTNRRVVWHSDEGLIVAAPGGFSSAEATSGAYPISMMAQTSTFATRSDLTFFGSDAILYAWNHNQIPIGDENAPPVDTGIGFGGAGSFDVVALNPHQYVVARMIGTDLVIERYSAQPGTARVTLDGEWYRIPRLTRADGIALATFRGGFALWYAEHGTGAADTADRWTAQPFRVRDDELVVCQSPYVFEHPAITYRDNDLLAIEDGDRLFVVGAVHYESNATGLSEHFINVEGPFWSGFSL